MKRLFGVSLGLLLAAGVVYAQDEEFITIFNFEEPVPPTITADWNMFFDFSVGDEPVHSGAQSLIMDIGGTTAEWIFSQWSFPPEVGDNGTVDLSGTDEMSVWVYSDQRFQMNWEFGGANLGYRFYDTEDLNTWKKLAWWYPGETATSFTEISGWGSFINPTAMNGFPAGFTGTIYMDDIQARLRQGGGEREFIQLNGFNTDADMAGVTFFDGIEGGLSAPGDIDPTEGDAAMYVVLDDGNDRFDLDITNAPEFEQYDRIHFDFFFDGSASWGNFSLNFDVTSLDSEGNEATDSTNLIGGSYTAVATGQWHTFVQQYGPVEGTDGFAFQTLKPDTISPAFAADGNTIELRLHTNGDAAVTGSRLYVDNIRLSRAAGTPISEWELH